MKSLIKLKKQKQAEKELLISEAQSLAKELGYTDLYWTLRRDDFRVEELEQTIRMLKDELKRSGK